jgi:hypothetical protein
MECGLHSYVEIEIAAAVLNKHWNKLLFCLNNHTAILTEYKNQILVRKLFQFVHFCINHPRTGHEGPEGE